MDGSRSQLRYIRMVPEVNSSIKRNIWILDDCKVHFKSCIGRHHKTQETKSAGEAPWFRDILVLCAIDCLTGCITFTRLYVLSKRK